MCLTGLHFISMLLLMLIDGSFQIKLNKSINQSNEMQLNMNKDPVSHTISADEMYGF